MDEQPSYLPGARVPKTAQYLGLRADDSRAVGPQTFTEGVHFPAGAIEIVRFVEAAP